MMRDSSWGDARARALLHAITADAAAKVGFKVGVLEVVRPRGLLEFVAISGSPDGARELLGTGSPLEDMNAAIADGETHGAFTFVAEEAYSPGVEEAMRGTSWVPDIPSTDDPGGWQPLDMLVAQVRDAGGTLRGLFYLDEPFGLRRLSQEALEGLTGELQTTLDTIVAVIEREEFAHLARSIRAARRMVQSSPARHDVDHLVREARTALLEALSVDELEIHVFLEEEAGVTGGLGVELTPDARQALQDAVARAWAEHDRVLIIESGQIWGDTEFGQAYAARFASLLEESGLETIVVAPVGVEDEVLGMIVAARRTGSRRWTDGESLAALEMGHDLGRALANAHATQRERRLLEELRSLEESRHRFLRELTHEINNPMTVIAANAELLVMGDDTRERELERARAILRGTGRLSELLEGLAALSRVSDPQRPLALEQLDLLALVEDTIASMTAVAQRAGITLHLVGDTGPAHVLANPREIASAVTNLVDNAVKYSDAGHEIWLGIEHRADGGLTFSCKDEGLGISEADQLNLFAPLFRSTNEEALLRPGTGLGLGIVREIMQRHGGAVEVDSTLGRGTTFRLHFRAPAGEDGSVPAPRGRVLGR